MAGIDLEVAQALPHSPDAAEVLLPGVGGGGGDPPF